jgi:hypothetical protein
MRGNKRAVSFRRFAVKFGIGVRNAQIFWLPACITA